MIARAVAVGLSLASCARSSAPSPAPSSSAAPSAIAVDGPGLGEVMVLVGRRFETAGRAIEAGRFELADFEVGELEELFEGDVPRATLPKEGPTAHIAGMAKAFLETHPPELRAAAASRDRHAFEAAFARAAAACNACHQASQKAFIVVPAAPGRSIPDLDPVAPPAPSSASSR